MSLQLSAEFSDVVFGCRNGWRAPELWVGCAWGGRPSSAKHQHNGPLAGWSAGARVQVTCAVIKLCINFNLRVIYLRLTST